MAGSGPPPDDQRVRRAAPKHPWQHARGTGWQHGPVPEPPDGLTAAATEAWRVWFAAWWAAFWTPDDLPALRQLVRLYNEVEKGQFQRAAELRLAMDAFGVTPKGRQVLRWRPPLEPEAKPQAPGGRRYESVRERLRLMAATEAPPPNGNGAA